MASWLVCSTPRRVVRVRVLAGDIVVCLGQDTLLPQCLSSPRCINGYRRNAGVKNTPSRLMLRKPGISTGVLGHWLGKRLPTFHSRDQQPYWITETKESICVKIEFNFRRISLVHHHGRHFFVLNTNMAAVTSCENALLKANRIKRLGY